MISIPFPSENLSDAFGAVNVSSPGQERAEGPLSLWNYHAILVNPESTRNQARQAKRLMLEVLEDRKISRDRPMLVPTLHVPEPGERASFYEKDRTHAIAISL